MRLITILFLSLKFSELEAQTELTTGELGVLNELAMRLQQVATELRAGSCERALTHLDPAQEFIANRLAGLKLDLLRRGSQAVFPILRALDNRSIGEYDTMRLMSPLGWATGALSAQFRYTPEGGLEFHSLYIRNSGSGPALGRRFQFSLKLEAQRVAEDGRSIFFESPAHLIGKEVMGPGWNIYSPSPGGTNDESLEAQSLKLKLRIHFPGEFAEPVIYMQWVNGRGEAFSGYPNWHEIRGVTIAVPSAAASH